MADYFETEEESVKEYDSRIAGRILSYLKPHRVLAVMVFIALAFSTLGELAVPVLQQRLIDRAVMVRFLPLRLGGKTAGAFAGRLTETALKSLWELSALEGALEAGEFLFVPRDEKVRLSRRVETELRQAGILADGQWYAFPLSDGERGNGGNAGVENAEAENANGLSFAEFAALAEKHPGVFVTGENAAALTSEDLASLPPEEKERIRGRDLSLITRTVLIILLILALVFFFTFVQTWASVLIGQRVMKDIRLELFKKTASQSTAFLSRNPVGRIVTRLTGDVETINEFFTSVLIAFLKDFSVMAGSLGTLFILSPRLAGVVILTLPPVLVLTAFSRVRARDAFRRQRSASSRLNSYLSERLSGIQAVQLFLGEKRSAEEFARRDRDYLKANLAEMFVYATFRPVIDFLSALTMAAVIAAGAVFVLDLSLSLGVLIAFINLTGLFYAPVMDIAEKYTLLQSAMAGGERVFALLDTNERIPDPAGRVLPAEAAASGSEAAGKSAVLDGSGTVPLPVRGRIEFKNVSFAYKEGEDVLNDLSFTVQPGEMAAIVGYTGAGKTTITNVLTRLWDIQSGSVTLDGIPVEDIPLEDLRRSVLPVLQEVFLFSGSVADNITLGLPLEKEQIAEAARAVHADEFIRSLPDGYDTVLSEGASNISSGQRQLLSFARVIAHNPALVILDEATSSVDTETERLIQLGIQKVLLGRTSIVIAHRLSTIRHADRILVLSGGRLVEEGRHDELIAQNGLYAGLYRLQFGN